MAALTDLSYIKALLSRHGFTFSKALGQNFLINPSVCPKMAELSGLNENAGALEIGPGIGVLTEQLAKRSKHVVAVELDKRLLPLLAETLSPYDNISIINDDILKADLPKIIEDEFYSRGITDIYVCANLPYYITSPVIMHLLESELPFKSLTFMVQKEAADRLCAKVGSRDSGAVTVAVAVRAKAEKLFTVQAGSFFPAPKVDSAVIRLTPYEVPPVKIDNMKFFSRFVRAAFEQRRKTLANSVASALNSDKASISQALKDLGLNESVRAEALSLEELAAVANTLYSISKD
ncbi:MAG: 16S rRNA (adenine(1518)-N(6)/adenine(1519)-N(6))-dimethyltransferase RsmA [Clostridiales bacterium]|nr:16S rRNA (adenine(1518)-N(6)/adenine(1519)-N(6))-dimethyltransferase RsmA [Clostridiales bacterium]